jgi:hypothetical protein
MYESVSGKKKGAAQGELSGLLKNLGYDQEQV